MTFLKYNFFRAVLGTQQNRLKDPKISYIPPSPIPTQLPHYQHSAPQQYICYN